MSSAAAGDTSTVKTTATPGCKALADPSTNTAEMRRLWKECSEESFWYRALPLSLGSVAVTGGLIYRGIWKSSKRFGPFPKLAVAGILGYAVGKASYVRTCLKKFNDVGIDVGPSAGFWSRRRCPASGQRSCQHVCEECKKMAQAAPAEQNKS